MSSSSPAGAAAAAGHPGGGGGGINIEFTSMDGRPGSPPPGLMEFIMASTQLGLGQTLAQFDEVGNDRSSSTSSGNDDSGDDSDSMPPLEEIAPPMRSSSSAVTAAAAPSSTAAAAVAAAAAAGTSSASKAYDSDNDSSNSDDDSVIEIVDLPDEQTCTDNSPPYRRTRSHDINSNNNRSTRSRIGSAAATASGGLKTTGLDDGNAAESSSSSSSSSFTRAAGRKRSAPCKSDDNDSDVEVEADAEKPSCKKGGDGQDQHCSICLETPSRDDVTTLNNCEHLFCFDCIEQWADRENTCPLCKVRFTKIERVHKPPPSKRRKTKGGSKSGGKKGDASSAARATKRIKNRDQKADLAQANPLASLFESMEASGTMPRSIAQLIFSGLGGINVGSGPRGYGTAATAAAARSASSRAARGSRNANAASSSASSSAPRRDPTTGRFRRRAPPPGAASSASRSSASRPNGHSVRVTTGNGVTSVVPGTSSVSITLNSLGPTSLALPGAPPGFLGGAYGGSPPSAQGRRVANAASSAAAAAQNPFSFAASGRSSRRGPRSGHFYSAARRSSSTSFVDDDSDEEVSPLDDPDLDAALGSASARNSSGYDTFVRRVRANAAAGASSSGAPPSRAGGLEFYPGLPPMAFTRHFHTTVPPPTRHNVPPANTRDTAIEIGDSDSDDDEVILVD